ncbi:hypothetical protein SKAU_G00396560 [Synaphobranchus kaupii]|uniref:Uncharacterized protein n=1 Tax=Synaphobranchus kaupii TaxID=118154 RepID=A0A9Q1IC40_SYNKA|nr:hypothetical protein SKAU_G00396560 [Synaphobranchus kaupii]
MVLDSPIQCHIRFIAAITKRRLAVTRLPSVSRAARGVHDKPRAICLRTHCAFCYALQLKYCLTQSHNCTFHIKEAH